MVNYGKLQPLNKILVNQIEEQKLRVNALRDEVDRLSSHLVHSNRENMDLQNRIEMLSGGYGVTQENDVVVSGLSLKDATETVLRLYSYRPYSKFRVVRTEGEIHA